ncbi:MAG: thiaminase II [Coxiellaceae bacterium]|nr:thiaminase II [Coxiellaceae bacterium]
MHSFNKELLDGTLCKKRFVFYLLQDKFYLTEYAKALALTAARLNNNNDIKMFLQFALEAIDDEQALHTKYLRQFKSTITDLNITEPSPSCFMYTNFLLQSASTKPVEQAIAALLPCFYIYQKVAEHMTQKINNLQLNPYHEWIALYASEEFQRSTDIAFNILDDLTTHLNNHEHVKTAFIYSAKLEWMFWDSAYHKQSWAI